MSTNYYYCVDGISSVFLDEGGAHDRVTIWQNGGNAGTLTVEKGYGRYICTLFADKDAYQPPMYTTWGGESRGCLVHVNINGLDKNLCLIDEYGEPTTVGAVLALQGKGKNE